MSNKSYLCTPFYMDNGYENIKLSEDCTEIPNDSINSEKHLLHNSDSAQKKDFYVCRGIYNYKDKKCVINDRFQSLIDNVQAIEAKVANAVNTPVQPQVPATTQMVEPPQMVEPQVPAPPQMVEPQVPAPPQMVSIKGNAELMKIYGSENSDGSGKGGFEPSVYYDSKKLSWREQNECKQACLDDPECEISHHFFSTGTCYLGKKDAVADQSKWRCHWDQNGCNGKNYGFHIKQ